MHKGLKEIPQVHSMGHQTDAKGRETQRYY